MPTSSSLVTNLPADFNTFGQAVDTSMSELLGGTTGQVLSKTSNTNMDFTWVTPTDQTPLTTKGDLFTFSTVDARLGVGTNGQYLQADSTASTGLKWATPATGGMTLLATTALTGGSVTVSSLSTYKQLCFVWKDVYLAASSYIEFRFNSDSGGNYGWQNVRMDNTTLSCSGGQTAATTAFYSLVGTDTTATRKFQGSINVYAADQTNGVSYFGNGNFYTTTNKAEFSTGRYNNSAVISSATFFAGASSYSGGTLLTYGVN